MEYCGVWSSSVVEQCLAVWNSGSVFSVVEQWSAVFKSVECSGVWSSSVECCGVWSSSVVEQCEREPA